MKPKSTILIVDDQPAMQDTFKLVLAEQGYNLVFASNGMEALTKAIDPIPDVILLDVMMPGMDGFEVCARLRAHPMLSDVPIIIITALNDTKSRLRGIKAGADEFVSKPFDTAELRARLRTITQLNRYKRLMAERTKFEWVVNQASDGYLILEDETIIYANGRARQFLSLPIDENQPILGTFPEIASENYRSEPADAWHNWQGPDRHEPIFLIQPESITTQPFWLQVDVLPLESGTEAGNWMVRLYDITAQKALQRDMWQFHLAVTHKLRTPLVGMLSGMELLVRHIDQLSKEDILQLADSAFRGAQRIRNEVEDIMKYMKAPRTTYAEKEPGFRFQDLSGSLTKITSELALDNITTQGLSDMRGIQVSLSKESFELILWEILENAQKFHPNRKPEITIMAEPISTNEISIKVIDDGVSLTPEQMANAWVPYYQGEKHFTGEVAGMGLGLSMVRNLVWEANGQCRLYNRKDRPGAIVEIVLPVVEINFD